MKHCVNKHVTEF